MVDRISVNKDAGEELLGKLPDSAKMWMSHGDKLTAVPKVFQFGTVPVLDISFFLLFFVASNAACFRYEIVSCISNHFWFVFVFFLGYYSTPE